MGRKSVIAKGCIVDGIKFPSTFQAKRYEELKLMQLGGLITDLQIEVEFPLRNEDYGIEVLTLAGTRIRCYTADATYREADRPQVLIVEEAKGRMMGEASLRLSVFQALYPQHELRIVKQKTTRRRKKRKKKS